MAELDFTKLDSDKTHAVWHGPSGGTTLGVTNVYEPLEAELNNTGGTSGVLNVTPSISWNDWDFGTQASESNNEPSMADAAAYEEFGQSNYGGGISYFLPAEYDDNSNLHSLVFDLVGDLDAKIDVATRLDGDVDTQAAAEDGDFVSVYRVEGGSYQNPFTPGESKRYTRGWFQKSDFAHYTVVGDHAITAIPPATTPWAEGTSARLRASQQGRDRTNALVFTTSDATVVDIDAKGGFYTVTGTATDECVITITDEGTGDTQTVNVTVT